METRISTNTFTNNLKQRISDLSIQQYGLLQQASTNQRIEYPSDDPAAFGHVSLLRAEKSDVAQYNRNVDQADAIVNNVYNTLRELNDRTLRAQELAEASSPGFNDNDLDPYAKEVKEILEQSVSLLNSKYLGNFLFAGTKLELTGNAFSVSRSVLTGEIVSVAYAGAKSSDVDYSEQTFTIAEATDIRPYTSGDTNEQFLTFLRHLISLRDAINAKDTTTIRSLKQNLIGDSNNIVGELGAIGAKQATIEVAQSQNKERFLNIDRLVSSETDADLAQTIVALTQAQSAYQAALQTGTMVMNTTLLNYLR